MMGHKTHNERKKITKGPQIVPQVKFANTIYFKSDNYLKRNFQIW
jgi:hypothetical protein